MKITLVTALLAALPAAPLLAGESPPHPGAIVYQEVCQACHMANAKGATGAGRIAALAANPNLAYPEYPIAVVTGGRGAMPWFRSQLTDQQIADVIGYVRTHYGNRYTGRITAVMVAQLGAKAPTGERP